MTKLNIRCCCQPTKILGTLEVPNHLVQESHIKVSTGVHGGPTVPHQVRMSEHVRLMDFNNGPQGLERAVYSEDRPLEFWQGIQGFEEVSNERH